MAAFLDDARPALTVGSVCSGIGAPEVAWGQLGWRFVWQAEIDAFPSLVLEHRFPAIPNLGDMTGIAARILAGEIEAPDVLVGGTPCQSFSIAGSRESLADARGNLALEFIRLADAIDAVRGRRGQPPVTILWENVPGVLSVTDNAFGCFLAGLVGEDAPLLPPRGKWTDAGLVAGPRRGAAWRILDAQFFGLAQRRRRVFVVASARDGADPGAVLFEPDRVPRHSAPSRAARAGFAGAPAPDAGGCGGGGIPGGLDRSAGDPGLGPQAWGGNNRSGPIEIATAVSAHSGPHGRLDFSVETFVTHTLRAEGFDGAEDGSGRGTPLVPQYAFQNRFRGDDGRGHSRPPPVSAEVCGTLETVKPWHVTVPAPLAFSAKDHGNDVLEDIAPTLRAMNSTQRRPNGGGQIAVAFQQNSRSEVRLMGGDGQVAGAIAAEPGVQQQNYVAGPAMAVRRLTPRECERLQGFPDDFTLLPVGVRKKIEDDFFAYLLLARPDLTREQAERLAKDGPRYKALGNSMAVPVIRWIGIRLEREYPAVDSLPD